MLRELLHRPDPDGDGGDAPATTTTTLLLVRHGHAGDRERWEGPDERRPLSKKGRRQAAGLVDLLAEFPVGRILSSHYVRCLETVVPLAGERRRSVEIHPALAEGASVADIAALVAELSGGASGGVGATAALCTHGDVLLHFLDLAHHDGDDPPLAKGSTWVMEAIRPGGQLAAVRYLPPAPAKP